MNGHLRLRRGLMALGAAAALLSSSPASAQKAPPGEPCYVAGMRENLIYVTGSSAVRNFLAPVAQLLQAEGYTVVYQSQGSCVGVEAIRSDDLAKRKMVDTAGNWAVYFDAAGEPVECSLAPDGNIVDVGVSDVFASTCGAIEQPTSETVADYEGPIQPMTFVVPLASKQESISAEAAYLAFGLGGQSGELRADTWIDPTYYFIRNESSGTQQMLSHAIGMDAAGWWGEDKGGSSAVRDDLKKVVDVATANKAIGILSTDIADEERDELRILAFQAYGQSCAYWPDSTQFLQDKRNVRDGHYTVWGPLHFFARLGSDGLPTTAAAELVTRFAKPRLDQDLLATIIAKHLVPKCAMHVQRTEDMGPLSAYKTDNRCDCFFEATAHGQSPAECQPCASSSECPAERPACNYGYCEPGE